MSDRIELEGFAVADGKISFSVKESPEADSWYAWQGHKAITGAEASSYWKVSYSMDVTEEMAATENVNASLWVQADKDGENTVESQEDCVVWAQRWRGEGQVAGLEFVRKRVLD